MFKSLLAPIAILLAAQPVSAQSQQVDPGLASFHALYRELIETNTTLSSGSCTAAADKVQVRLDAAGFSASDTFRFAPPEKPREGGLVAELRGRNPALKPILLLAHLDVVEARREDWQRDPFALIEEDGFFYGRGSVDDKAQAAIWIDTLLRLKQAGVRPLRTVRVALTCGEETTGAFNGVEWLAKHRPDLLQAEFALNEGGGGRLSVDGKKQVLTIQVGEKAMVNFRIEAKNPGGHASRPVPENAIYDLAGALAAIRGLDFPVRLNAATTAFFSHNGKALGGDLGGAMLALVRNPADRAAQALLSRDPTYRAMLRTTCIPTLIDGGHANNALPQRAAVNLNCRILPGETIDDTERALTQALNGHAVSLHREPPARPLAIAPPLNPRVIGPAEAVGRKFFPGIPLIPIMSTGATDSVFLSSVGVPVYGIPGLFREDDQNGVHGVNERMRVRSLNEGRAYLFELIRRYAGAQ